MDLNLIPNIKHINSNNLFLLAGPFTIEGKELSGLVFCYYNF